MEDEVHQDQEVSLAIVHKLVDGLERDFLSSRIEEEKTDFVVQGMFILATFLTVLRGKEVFQSV